MAACSTKEELAVDCLTAIIELAEDNPKFFKPHMEAVVSTCHEITGNSSSNCGRGNDNGNGDGCRGGGVVTVVVVVVEMAMTKAMDWCVGARGGRIRMQRPPKPNHRTNVFL